jgi:hypothetical protein
MHATGVGWRLVLMLRGDGGEFEVELFATSTSIASARSFLLNHLAPHVKTPSPLSHINHHASIDPLSYRLPLEKL